MRESSLVTLVLDIIIEKHELRSKHKQSKTTPHKQTPRRRKSNNLRGSLCSKKKTSKKCSGKRSEAFGKKLKKDKVLNETSKRQGKEGKVSHSRLVAKKGRQSNARRK